MENNNEVYLLVEQFKNGNDDAFIILINSVKESVYKVIYGIVENRDNTLEILDEVIYKAYTNLKKIKHNEFFKTWIIRIAINESKNYIKKNSKVVYINEYAEEYKNSGDYDEKIDVGHALSKLDVNTKSVMIMKLYLEYTFEDIATTLEKPISTIKTIYYAGLQKLKKFLKDEEVN